MHGPDRNHSRGLGQEGLGLQDRVVGLAGEELTTFTYGHFGVFPLVVDPARPSGSAVTWFNRLAPAVSDATRPLAGLDPATSGLVAARRALLAG